MREVCLGLLVVSVTLAHPAHGQEIVLPTALAESRHALGGAALDDIRTLRIVGHGSRDTGPLRLSGDFELKMAFPDRYVRVDRLMIGGLSSVMTAGFNGAAPIQRAIGPDGVRIDPTLRVPDASKAAILESAVAVARQDLALLLLGFFGSSLDVYSLQFADAGMAESPEGKAHVIAVRGAGEFAARLFLDAGTRLPLMVSWLAPDALAVVRNLLSASRATGSPPPASAEALAAQRQPSVEHRLYFSDYRQVGAVRWPFRLRRSIGGTVVEELTIDTFTLNPGLSAEAFDPQP